MKVCILAPGNQIGGGVKMPVRLASHLAQNNDITLKYPIVKHFTTYHKLRKSSWRAKLRYIRGEVRSYKRQFVFESDLDKNVKLRTYLLAPSEKILKQFDAIIYVSVWQYHELKHVTPDGVRRIHWSLADYLFSNCLAFPIDTILEAYLSDDILVAPSEAVRTHLQNYGAKVHSAIHGGVDPLFNDEERHMNKGMPAVLGYFQPAWWVKGAATLIQVLRQIRREFPTVRIELLGHQTSNIQNTGTLVCDRFHTGLSSKQVADLYRAHDIFVYPSYSDGFQSPPLEAMACGCAVVATRVAAVPEYATHEHNALLCQPMDADDMFRQVERLILDADLRAHLSRNAARETAQWTWENCAAKFNALLREAVGGATQR